MTGLRRVSQATAITVLVVLALALVLEATDAIGGQWRADGAQAARRVAMPTWEPWVSGVLGLGLALLGIVLVAAQIAPQKKGLNSMHEVYRSDAGDTRIRGRAAVRAVQYELGSIDGVVETVGRVQRKTVHAEVLVDDRANFADVEAEARLRLGHQFWIDLGLADFSLHLIVTHHPQPPRVR